MDIYQERIRPLFDGASETNAEIERRLGITPKTINKWNKTSLKSYTKFIPQIAAYFHVSTDYLLGNTDDPTPAGQKERPPAQGGELSDDESKLILLFRQVPAEQQSAMIQAIEMTLRSQGLL